MKGKGKRGGERESGCNREKTETETQTCFPQMARIYPMYCV